MWGYCFIYGEGRPRPELQIKQDTFLTPFLCTYFTGPAGNERTSIFIMNLNHYTNAAGLEGILKNDFINLRATRFSHLNDSKEYIWINEKIRDKKDNFCKNLDIPFDPDLHTYPYVICFADLPDDHLMWKLYGSEGKGYMLTLDYDGLENFAIDSCHNGNDPDHLQSIIYADDTNWEQQFNICLQIYNKIEGIYHSTDIDKACALMKRRIYEHENETRYMRCIHDGMDFHYNDGNPIITYDGEDPTEIKFRASAYGITPYIDINLPKDLLKSITIGYDYNFQSQHDAIKLLLQSRGYIGVEILQSQIIP